MHLSFSFISVSEFIRIKMVSKLNQLTVLILLNPNTFLKTPLSFTKQLAVSDINQSFR